MTVRQLCLVVLTVTSTISTAYAQPTVVYESDKNLIDTTDYTGVAPYWWFANFDTAALETGQPVQQNENSNLPSWFTLDPTFDPDPLTTSYTWSDNLVLGSLVNEASSIGGNAGFNRITLPDGTTGLSGQAVDTKEAGNGGQSNDILKRVILGNDAPPSFRLWVVVDNEDTATMTGVRRVKARIRGTGVPADTEDDTSNSIDDTRNNIADAYAFLYQNVSPGQEIAIQLRNSNSSSAGGTGMAGFMIQGIPEPTSMALLGICTLVVGSMRRLRR